MKKLTEALEEHWKMMIHAAIAEATRQASLPHFEKAFVEIEEVLPGQKRRAKQAKVRKEGLRRYRRNPSFCADNFALTFVDVPIARRSNLSFL